MSLNVAYPLSLYIIQLHCTPAHLKIANPKTLRAALKLPSANRKEKTNILTGSIFQIINRNDTEPPARTFLFMFHPLSHPWS